MQAAWYAPVTVLLALALVMDVAMERGKQRWEARELQDLASDVEGTAASQVPVPGPKVQEAQQGGRM